MNSLASFVTLLQIGSAKLISFVKSMFFLPVKKKYARTPIDHMSLLGLSNGSSVNISGAIKHAYFESYFIEFI
jgi:hypothetical protein